VHVGNAQRAVIALQLTLFVNINRYLTFAICIALFPGLSTSLRSKTLSLGSYFPILVVAAYNVSDLLGKITGNFVVPTRSGLVGLIALQLLSVPVLILSKYADDAEGCGNIICWVLRNDLTKLVVVSYLGILTGYTSKFDEERSDEQ